MIRKFPAQAALWLVCLAVSFSSTLAGGGIKGGVVHGATDEVGSKAVDSPHHYSDLHATILRQLGLNHKTELEALGRTFKLVEKGAPIQEVIA